MLIRVTRHENWEVVGLVNQTVLLIEGTATITSLRCWTNMKGSLISCLFRENHICRDVEWERYFCYKSMEVPELYSGPHLIFPMTFSNAAALGGALQEQTTPWGDLEAAEDPPQHQRSPSVIVDMLWSDPMPKSGSVPNEVLLLGPQT
ncbi:hypothetical protein J4Q44_G00076490 [Coregonus suidteri]|uniref:Uncharacterized protein n=1 Tax=Coregonus suidteri TaxID=861788 RepID=A0AAN8MAZ7_9TELE